MEDVEVSWSGLRSAIGDGRCGDDGCLIRMIVTPFVVHLDGQGQLNLDTLHVITGYRMNFIHSIS